MKEVRIVLTDEEHFYLINLKNRLEFKNWHNFILSGAESLDVRKEEQEE